VQIDWNQIRRQHGPLVWGVAWRILNHHDDALDCAQEVFVEAYQRSQATTIDNWAGFLRWLTTRRALDLVRLRRRRNATTAIDSATPSAADTTDQGLVYDELMQRVRTALGEISQSQATAFWLVCVEEMSYREVAAQMEIEINAVGVLVHRARQHLKTTLADEQIGAAKRTARRE